MGTTSAPCAVGQRGHARVQIGGVPGGADQRGARSDTAAAERERAADALDTQPLRHGGGGERRRGGTPGHQVADLAGRQRPPLGRGVVRRRHRGAARGDGRGAGHDLDVVDQRQAPGGDVVDLVGLPAPAARFLTGDELGRLLGLQVEQVANQPAGGLRAGDEIGAGGDRAPADGHRLGGAPHLDALGRQVARQPLGPATGRARAPARTRAPRPSAPRSRRCAGTPGSRAPDARGCGRR